MDSFFNPELSKALSITFPDIRNHWMYVKFGGSTPIVICKEDARLSNRAMTAIRKVVSVDIFTAWRVIDILDNVNVMNVKDPHDLFTEVAERYFSSGKNLVELYLWDLLKNRQ